MLSEQEGYKFNAGGISMQGRRDPCLNPWSATAMMEALLSQTDKWPDCLPVQEN